MVDQSAPTLYQSLCAVPDPRAAKGKRYPWEFLLLTTGAALAAGKRKLSEITGIQHLVERLSGLARGQSSLTPDLLPGQD